MEVLAEERHEYRDGEIVVMAGGLPNHNQVAGNNYLQYSVGSLSMGNDSALRKKVLQSEVN